MRFRPCLDLRQGKVVQIVGSTLRDGADPITHFVADRPPAYFAQLYRQDGLEGGHLIMLGPGNEQAASQALAAFPGGMQIGGGIDDRNAPAWLEQGARQVIVTSNVFREGRLERQNLERLSSAVGREHLVLDLSCGLQERRYVVMTDRWQKPTDFQIDRTNLELLAGFCAEFLVHATHVEGKKQGIDVELVALLGEITPLPTTYAGGIRSWQDIEAIKKLGRGKIDFTVGSALDIFGGKALRYQDLVKFNAAASSPTSGTD